MKTRFIFIILSASFLFGPATAQDQDSARKLLDKAYSVYEKSDGIELSFHSTMMDKEGTSYSTQTGKALVRGEKFKLEMDNMIIWFDGKTQWVWMKEVNEVNVSTPSSNEIASISPLSILGIYKNGVTLKQPFTGKINGQSVQIVNMIPTNGNKEFKSITIALDKVSGNILQITVHMSDNTKNVIDILNYNPNYQFEEKTFQFDKQNHPEAEIVDLR